jgi:hypothetical protein
MYIQDAESAWLAVRSLVFVPYLFFLIVDPKSMPGGWVYIVTNRPDGTLYVGVTSDLARFLKCRITSHA